MSRDQGVAFVEIDKRDTAVLRNYNSQMNSQGCHLVGILDTYVDVDETVALTPTLVLQFWLRCGDKVSEGVHRKYLLIWIGGRTTDRVCLPCGSVTRALGNRYRLSSIIFIISSRQCGRASAFTS